MSRRSITWPCTGCISSSLSRYLAKNTNAPGEQLISRVLSRVSRTGLLQGPPGRALDYPGGRHHRRDPRNHPGCNRHLGPKDQMLPGMGRGGRELDEIIGLNSVGVARMDASRTHEMQEADLRRPAARTCASRHDRRWDNCSIFVDVLR